MKEGRINLDGSFVLVDREMPWPQRLSAVERKD